MQRHTLKALAVGLLLFVGLVAVAQTDDPANDIQGTIPAERAQGDVLFTITPGSAGGTPVGLEGSGPGSFWLTDIGDGSVNAMDDTGFVSSSFTTAGNPIGVTTNGSSIFVTDTTLDEVQIFNSGGSLTGSFSVATETTFPEGITYNSDTGTLFVVNGSGGNQVHEYTTSGSLVGSFSVNGSSQDGIAYSPECGGYWIYDSGTDTVRLYDFGFNEQVTFAGTIAAGFSGGEGVAFQDGIVYVVATGSDLIVAFDTECVEIPTLTEFGLIAMIALLLIASLVVMRRRRQQTA
jgi:DNA-binding beta-propeller fold protein YncE